MNDSLKVYAELLSAIVRFNSITTIVYYDPENGSEECQLVKLLSWVGKSIPLLLWRSVDAVKLSSLVNAQLVFVACLPGLFRLDLLKTIATSLQYIRETKLLIELASDPDLALVNRVLQYCLQSQMLNVAITFRDFGQTQTLYVYDAYPEFMLKSQTFSDQQNIFPDKTTDLMGYRIRTMPDLSEPNTILYRDKAGNIRLLGYVWNMVSEFSRKHNASLQLINEGKELKYLTHIQVLDLARDNIVDIAASVQPLTLRHLDRYHQYAYPGNIASWCTMLPKEPFIELREAYLWMMPAITFCLLAVLWLLHEQLRCRWQRYRRQLCIGWKVLAIMLICNVQGRLLMVFIAPPTKTSITSFDALSNSKLRLFGIRSEHNLYDFDTRTRYSQVFYLSNKMSDLQWHRNSLNTSYAYTVTYTKWQLYAEQQAFSRRPLFYYSEKFCFYQYVPFGLVIPENSPHRATLHNFILQLSESGLHNYWVTKSFYYMVQAGKLKIQEFGEVRSFHSLFIQDLYDVLLAYLLGTIISLILFGSELAIYHATYWLNN
ncbi:PREDICTED: uncharacterized protein LOC108610066 [Drosophila arizonae]|uniref:Uncharacterized protein LOC108610066 n=1 Tax=Drosophila arizonae TaxID=7263 RepID=A0ABM1NR07_DROAR|nr:PREDICTED: uncharacterized protein LOC108610066 [Drosophila arizonae]